MAHGWGEVWWGPAPHKSGPAYRPWVIVSDASHPFASEESIAVGMTTRSHDGAIPVSPDSWVRGGADVDSYVAPWYVATIKHVDFDRHQGDIDPSLVSDAVESLHHHTPPRRLD